MGGYGVRVRRRAWRHAKVLDEKVNVFNQVWDFGSYRRMFHPQKSLREAIAESV